MPLAPEPLSLIETPAEACCLDNINQTTQLKRADKRWWKNSRRWLEDYLFFAQPPLPFKPQLVPICPTQSPFICFICFCLVAQTEHIKNDSHFGEWYILLERMLVGISSFGPYNKSDWAHFFRALSLQPCWQKERYTTNKLKVNGYR